MNVDLKCEEHKKTMTWSHTEDLVLDVAFITASCISMLGSGFIM